ncbi:MAG: response regulator transcription factor [Verrucomicrobia bacterium]|nr:response regulator transcription factor [Verrucomicrobiota bacterium]
MFKNTYTAQGKRFQVRRWCVKIQHALRRRTFSLTPANRTEAAREALGIYQTILTHGWAHTEVAAGGKSAKVLMTDREPPKTHPAYWKPRLVYRKYTEILRPGQEPEFSARIQHEGISFYFPLRTNDEPQAAARAAEIYRTLAVDGWEEAGRMVRREVTVAVFWWDNPLAYTYTTVFTQPNEAENAASEVRPNADAGCRAILIEPDPGVRNALKFWLNRHKGFSCDAAYATPAEGLREVPDKKPDLVLVNRVLDEASDRQLLPRFKALLPDLAAFTYGVHEDADQVYYSFSGVSAGYITRRRPPTNLLDPVTSPASSLSSRQAAHLIRNYFQNFFSVPLATDEAPEARLLTSRENEILDHVSKGYVDKEIASRLGISRWTVHGHLKNIYEKLGVHTRTEAAVKYLQK